MFRIIIVASFGLSEMAERMDIRNIKKLCRPIAGVLYVCNCM